MKAYTLGLYEKSMPNDLSWREKLIAAKQAGYDFLEISIDETDEKLDRLVWGKEQRRELRELCREIGVPIHTMCLSGHRRFPFGSHDADVRKRSLEIMEGAIGLADDLGVQLIQLAGYDVYYEKASEQTRSWFYENLQRAVSMASSTGVMLGFETMETDFMNTVTKAMRYVTEMRSAYLGVYPDLGNITNAYQTDADAISHDLLQGKGHLMAMHLKETLPGRFREVEYGRGHVDFAIGIKRAWELGIRRYVAEFWYTGQSSWKAELQRSRLFLETYLLEQKEGGWI